MIKISIITSLYKSIKYLEAFINNYLEISNLKDTELIIIHNEATPEELAVINIYSPLIPNLIYQKVDLEGLYTSWNRAIKLSCGKYLAMWNVDDRRTPYSLAEQSRVLDTNKDCMIVSGNYYKVFNYGDETGYYKKDPVKKSNINPTPKCNNGCFLMWKRDLHEEIGYFDEQFKISGDVEFWYRVTSRYKALPTNVVLGFYLRINDTGLSKQKDRSDIEHEVIRIRYHNLFITNFLKLMSDHTIKYNMIQNFSKYIPILTKKYLIIRLLPSFILFWMPWCIRIIVRMKYKILERIQTLSNKR